MNIDTSKYGTAGIPKFNTSTTVELEGAAKGAIAEIDGAFNNLVTVVGKHTATGNNYALWFFGMALQGVYGLAKSCIIGKPVLNA